ncbi:hypothetical protein [Bradyrhizobium vignae]|uniref:hypothetical protein n=1 Tax=Bradyrhizobium TaxID=374 RepID=UPI001FE1A4BA|nr:hypothetical protein [Bradyrhizobium vignae]
MRIVICGGVIGACTAEFLGRHDIDVVVVERTEVAAASGFVASDGVRLGMHHLMLTHAPRRNLHACVR